jgi:hypothetical protein
LRRNTKRQIKIKIEIEIEKKHNLAVAETAKGAPDGAPFFMLSAAHCMAR